MGAFQEGQTEDDLIEELVSGDLKISKNPPFRDTVAVPASGYTVIRILAKNPGMIKQLITSQTQLTILILGWCILLRMYYNKNDNCYPCSRLGVSLLYI
jgi:hypothetical protein